ncbi:GNAT family N-acetyltransferase [Halostella litorea]|uniref:GNAT family N-acetyltransferase n=1 Tax=Halostella litorea TaxID=2528831 RepID=UPI001092A9E7|nr:GNAT family N-acetyltransferase [Halostella litorea]
MDLDLLGWPPDGPTLRLDYERFSYAGKFVMSNTGKAVVRPGADDDRDLSEADDDSEGEAGTPADQGDDYDAVLAAAAFNEDRTDAGTLWIRYITVRKDLRGEGIGPDLADFVADRAADRGYERVRIAVNNPFAYEALYKAGFGYTGETTGIAELVLERPGDRSAERYRAGMAEFRGRGNLSDAERAFVAAADTPPARA